MVEVKFEIVKPNFQIREYKSVAGDATGFLYSLERAEDVAKSARAINGIVERHINGRGLRVRESDFKVLEYRRGYDKSKTYSFSLEAYLDILDRRNKAEGVESNLGKLFGLSHNVEAASYEDAEEIIRWAMLKKDLASPNKTFDEWEKDTSIRYDRVKTLDNMKRAFVELDAKILNQEANLIILPARENFVGFVSLNKLREEGKEKVDSTKSELIEKLREFEGPCLSCDAFDLYMQRARLLENYSELVSKFGDILLNPNWKERFFRFDP